MPVREYRISPELQRCCWYVAGGAVGLLGVFYWVNVFVLQRGLDDMARGLILFAATPFLLAAVLNWRLRFDESGIARRRCFRWDRWTWDDLASGRIRKRHPYTLVDPQRPWWRRSLSLDCLATVDRRAALVEINAHYRLPPPPELSERLTIKWGLRCRATFDRNGIVRIDGV